MATVQENLLDAQAKYHALLTGTAAVEVRDQNGEMVRYSVANRSALKTYIQDLTNEANGTKPLGPMRTYG